jgi:hypothetical protein
MINVRTLIVAVGLIINLSACFTSQTDLTDFLYQRG